jgi:hypothetical protein
MTTSPRPGARVAFAAAPAYRFRCGEHGGPLIGTPEFADGPGTGECTGVWQVDLSEMICPGGADGSDCQLTWQIIMTEAPPAPPVGRYPDPDPAAADWDAAYPPLTDEAACLLIRESLVDSEFLWLAIMLPPGGERAEVTVLDAVTSFQGNCWDDQHDGGAHRRDLVDANRLLGWIGRPDLRDDYADVHSLVSDDAPEPEHWENRP